MCVEWLDTRRAVFEAHENRRIKLAPDDYYGAENGAAVCRNTMARRWRGRGARVCTWLAQSIAGRSSIIRSEVHCGLAAPRLAVRKLNGQHSLFFGLGSYWLTGASVSHFLNSKD